MSCDHGWRTRPIRKYNVAARRRNRDDIATLGA